MARAGVLGWLLLLQLAVLTLGGEPAIPLSPTEHAVSLLCLSLFRVLVCVCVADDSSATLYWGARKERLAGWWVAGRVCIHDMNTTQNLHVRGDYAR